MNVYRNPFLKALSGLSINISAAWFVAPFIGPTISFPKNYLDIVVLTADLVLGIVFLILTIICERKLKHG